MSSNSSARIWLAAFLLLGACKSNTSTSTNDHADMGSAMDSGSTVDSGPDANVVTDAGVAQDLGSSMDATLVTNDMGADASVPLIPAETCLPDAPVLTNGTWTQSIVGYAGDYSFDRYPGCETTYGGGDGAYRVVLLPGERIVVSATPDSSQMALNILPGTAETACSAASMCAASASQNSGGSNSPLAFENTSGTIFYGFLTAGAIDDPGGTYSLTVNIAPPPSGDTCTSAIPLTGTLADQTFAGDVDDYTSTIITHGCSFLDTPDRVYSVTVPAGQTLVATATGASNPAPQISLVPSLSTCGTSDLACSRVANSQGGSTSSVTFSNPTSSAQTIGLIVEPYMNASDTFSINATLSPILPGETCLNAVALSSGAIVMDTTAGYSNDYTGYADANCGAIAGVDRVYSFVVPASDALSANVVSTDDSGFVPTLTVLSSLDNCTPQLMCKTSAVQVGSTAASVFFYDTSGIDTTYYLIVGTTDATHAGGGYRLEVTYVP